jgi:outer membrane autotransporter protein
MGGTMFYTQSTDPAAGKTDFSVCRKIFPLTLLSAALSLAASPAVLAYDAANPLLDLHFKGSEIQTGYTYPEVFSSAFDAPDDKASFIAIMMSDPYNLSEEKARYFVETLTEFDGPATVYPEGVNVTVDGTVNLLSAGEFANSTEIKATGNLVFEGEVSGGVKTALVTSASILRAEGQNITFNGNIRTEDGVTNITGESDVTFNGDLIGGGGSLTASAGGAMTVNGNIEQNGSYMTFSAASALTVNGSISGRNDDISLKSDKSVTVNGDIYLTGSSDTSGKAYVRYYLFDYDDLTEYFRARPYFKQYPPQTNEMTEDNFDAHNFYLTGALYDTVAGSVIHIGEVPSLLTTDFTEISTPSASVKINGNITVENSYDTANSVKIALKGDGSAWSWKGSATMLGSGCANCALNEKGIYIYAHEGAVWQVEGADSTKYTNFNKVSSISRWTSYGNSVIDMTKTPDTMLLTIDELVGSGTVIKEKVDPNHTADSNLTDMVVLGGRSRGVHTVELHSTGAEPMEIKTGRVPYLQVTVPCAVSQFKKQYMHSGETRPWLFLVGYDEQIGSALKLSTEDSASGEGRTAHIQIDGTRYYTYYETGVGTDVIVLTKDFPELTINYGNLNNELDVGTRKYKILDPVVEADGSVVFYVEMEGVLPDGTPAPTSSLPFNELSTGTELVTTLAGDGAVYSAWMADLSDLRKRLGEVRYGAQDGLWVKGIAQKDKIKGMTGADFKQKLYGLQLGLDHIVTQNEDRMWLMGANFKYNTIDQKVDAMRYGKGDLKTYGAFLYATYADYKGYYTDLVLSIDSYKQKMTAEQTDSSYVHGKYNTWGWGASVEVGKMFSSAQDDEGWGPWYSHWWIEPQAQLAYYRVNGKKFSMDNGMTVQQKNGDSLIGRLGVVIGKKFNYGKNRKEVDKRYSQFYLKGGVKHEFLGGQTVRVNNDTFNGKLRGTRVYYGAGFDWNMTDQLRLYAQVERESGSKYKKDYEVSVGLKWQF